jgi:hypothetical protein
MGTLRRTPRSGTSPVSIGHALAWTLAVLLGAFTIGCTGNISQPATSSDRLSPLNCANPAGGFLPPTTVCDPWMGIKCSGTSAACPSPLLRPGEQLFAPSGVCQ